MVHIAKWLVRGDHFRVTLIYNEQDGYYHATLERQELNGQWYEFGDGFGPRFKDALDSLNESLAQLPD